MKTSKVVESIISAMTLREKVQLLSGQDNWRTASIPRVGIRPLTMTDGPHGVRANFIDKNRIAGTATAFPTGIGMASTWDPGLIDRAARVMAHETRALGCDVLLGPCINIVRSPLGGRNFETFAEDPFFAGRMGCAYVKGLQSVKIGASLKHFACNNQEIERTRGSSEVDERTLREIYLPAFEYIVKEAQPWTVMCSYNRINGVYASQNKYLLTDILRNEWGFKGIVVSDWSAVHDIVGPVKAGLNIEMPGPAKYFGRLLEDAVDTWQIEKEEIDRSVRQVLCFLEKAGKLGPARAKSKSAVNHPSHQKLSRDVAAASMVLLKNDNGTLPITRAKIQSIAVLGPNVEDFQISGGGSSRVEPPYTVNPLKALQKLCGSGIKTGFERGCDNYTCPAEIKEEYITQPAGKGKGFVGEYFNNGTLSGRPAAVRKDRHLGMWHVAPPEEITCDRFSVRWSGLLKAPGTGRYQFTIKSTGQCNLYFDNTLIIRKMFPDQQYDHGPTEASAFVSLEKGRTYKIRIEETGLIRTNTLAMYLYFGYMPRPQDDLRMQRAVSLASRSDCAIVYAGMPFEFDSEGGDRPHMDLPGRQNELITKVCAVNKNVIVVLNCGAPVTMPWIDKVQAVLFAQYPGLEGGAVIADILFGRINPSGKLTVTFPKAFKDNPAFGNYPGGRKALYGEGILVGYRYFEAKGIEPLFPFGHGLSYTRFEYSALRITHKDHSQAHAVVSCIVKNTGSRPGKEVVQLYVADPISSLVRAPKELKGFKKVFLLPGARATLTFELDERSFSYYNPETKSWVAEPGKFDILIGASSRDIRLKGSMVLA